MSQVKLVARTLDLYELYATKGEPLSLTQLAEGLLAPMSSTLALVRTLISKGYLYQTRKRTYYPTKKLTGLCQRIDSQDPVLDLLHPYLERLRDGSGETAVLGTREGLQVIYLDVVHSNQAIRYMAQPGEVRSLHANSLGKALLSVLEDDQLLRLLGGMDMDLLTDKTLASRQTLIADLVKSRQRGWTANIGESVADLAAIAAPICLAKQWYALSIVGPLARMQAAWDQHVATLIEVVEEWDEAQQLEDL